MNTIQPTAMSAGSDTGTSIFSFRRPNRWTRDRGGPSSLSAIALNAIARKLKQFNNTLSEQVNLLVGRLESLRTSWRDQENLRFAEEFKELLRLLVQFIEVHNLHIPYLLRKAERLEEYLNQR